MKCIDPKNNSKMGWCPENESENQMLFESFTLYIVEKFSFESFYILYMYKIYTIFFIYDFSSTHDTHEPPSKQFS